MPTTQKSDLIIPEVFAEEFVKGIAGMNVLNGSGVFSVNTGLQSGGSNGVGQDVTIPYFESIGKAQEIPAGGAITPKKQTMSQEKATVMHLGDAISMSGWAQRAKSTGRSLYDVGLEQLRAGLAAKLEDICMDRLVARATAASMIADETTNTFLRTTPAKVFKLFGDELELGGGPALWAMNSKVYWDAAGLEDTTNRTLFTPAQGEMLARLGGVPIRMTDRATILPTSSPQDYYSPLAKRGAGAIWIDNAAVSIEMDRDSLADADLLIYHVYLVVHVYSVMNGGTKPGVAMAKTR